MHRTESKYSPRRIEATEKQRKALQLRMAGRTWQEIADALEYKSHASAIAAVESALKRTLRPPAEQFRALTLERLTMILQVWWPALLQRDEKAADIVLKTNRQISDLLGLNAPVKVEMKVEHMNTVILEMVNLFVQVNLLADPEERRKLFAEGADKIVEVRLLKGAERGLTNI